MKTDDLIDLMVLVRELQKKHEKNRSYQVSSSLHYYQNLLDLVLENLLIRRKKDEEHLAK